MKCNIPIKKINADNNAYAFHERFFIQDVHAKLNGETMIELLHRHNFFFILVLQKGIGHHEIDFRSYSVTNYSLYFIKPGQVHQLTLQPESKGYLLYFSADSYYANNKSLNQLLNKVSNQNFYQLDLHFFEKIFPLLDAIYDEYINRNKGYEEIIRANLNILFTKLTRNHDNKNTNETDKYTQERLEEFLQLLEKHIVNKKLVSQYAGMMNLSSYQLNKIIKSSLDKTCSEAIKEHIILEAKRHLLATSNLVNQIALSLGYEDVSYFIRLFKKHTGHSPNAFRINFKKVHIN